MPRSLASRLFALTVALTTLVVAPVSALAHGYAHHEESEHVGEVAHPEHGGQTSRTTGAHLVVEPAEHEGGDHPHATVGAALLKKGLAPLVAVIASRVLIPRVAVVEVVPPETNITSEPRASMTHAPPPTLRGPPVVLG